MASATKAVVERAGGHPSRWSAFVFRFKVICLQSRRGLQNLQSGPRCHSAVQVAENAQGRTLEHRSKLRTSDNPAEIALQLGKIHNLRIAAKRLDQVEIPAGQVFSFWSQVGRATRRRGFQAGRELREGCIIATVGGGLCQLSNALYDLALRSNCEILERHAHSQIVPGSASELGRDATVAWNHVDLRFRSDRPYRIIARLTRDDLVVSFQFADAPESDTPDAKQDKPKKLDQKGLRLLNPVPGTCETCNQGDCFRHDRRESIRARSGHERTAFVLDAVSPEFQQFVQGNIQRGDEILAPMAPRLPGVARYAWTFPDEVTRKHAFAATIQRTLHARRKLPPPALRKLQMADTDRIARRYAALLAHDATELVVDLPLLKELHRAGALGGRSVTVWLSRFPLKLLHTLLDRASQKYPEAPNLNDFRAADRDVDDEWAALLTVDRVVTPHAYLAAQLKTRLTAKVECVPWQLPSPPKRVAREGGYLYFPGPTTAREGALAVREAARRLNLPVVAAGKHLESPDFWQGITLLPAENHPIQDAAVVLCPAVMKNRPTAALTALAMDKPLIATAQWGLPSGALEVPFGDHEALFEAIREHYK